MGIILASQSPRRRELLTLAGIEYKVIVSDCDETIKENISPENAVKTLSERKAMAVFENNRDAVIIAADTVVAIEDKILGKPKDTEDAINMLKLLSGKKHQVSTGVCIISNDKKDTFAVTSQVEFYKLTQREIEEYVSTGEPMDKAGAYGIQGKGALLVKGISGDYFNIVGLPLAETVRHLKAFK